MKNFNIRCFIFIIFIKIILGYFIYGEQPKISFNKISIKDGLSSNSIVSFFQDNKGFVWVGTYTNGLNRYDGFDFKNFYHNSEDTTSLTSNFIKNIVQDSSGNLWIGTSKGINIYNYKREMFYNYKNNPVKLKYLNEKNVYAIFKDKRENIWVGFRDGLIRINTKTNEFIKLQNNSGNKESLSCDFVSSIAEDSKGFIWIGTWGGGLNKFDPIKKTFKTYKINSKILDNRIKKIIIDNKDTIWISTVSGLFFFNSNKKNKIEAFIFKNKCNAKIESISDIYLDNRDRLWIGTLFGLFSINIDRKNITCFFHDSSYQFSLSQNDVRAIFMDKSENIWIGTLKGGVNKLSRNSFYFKNIIDGNNPEKNLNNNLVWTIHIDGKGDLWAGTDNGINHYSIEKKKFFYHNIKNNKKSVILDNMISSITEDRNGNIWAGSAFGGLHKFNKITQQWTHFNHKKARKSLISDQILTLLYDESDMLLIGTTKGLDIFDLKTEKFIHFNNPLLNNKLVSVIYKDTIGNIWIGSNEKNRLGRVIFTNLKAKYIAEKSMFKNFTITSIYEDIYKRLWVGTSKGLVLYNYREETTEVFSADDGLEHSHVNSIIGDGNGSLWIGTLSSISRFRYSDKTFINYNTNDGLNSDEFSRRAVFKNNKGELFFGGNNGIVHFFPQNILVNTIPPNVEIIDFQLFNKPVKLEKNAILKKSILKTDIIKLKYDENYFSFSFSVLDYSNPEKNMYMYKLEGLDNEWIKTTGKKRTVTYTNLDPGTYRFKVKGSNSDGVWNEECKAIKIIIYPPFWETWWFRMLFLAFLIWIITILLRVRTKKLTEQLKSELAFEQFCKKYNISIREKEILKLTINGLNNKDIEAKLYISIGTIKNHLYSIYKKLNIKNRAQLINLFKNVDLNS